MAKGIRSIAPLFFAVLLLQSVPAQAGPIQNPEKCKEGNDCERVERQRRPAGNNKGTVGPVKPAPKAAGAPAGGVSAPTGSRPLVKSPAGEHVGPTANTTAVANGMSWDAKSLNNVVAFESGIAVTQPVEITVAFLSTAGPAQITKQSYVASTGNRFAYVDPEGDGKPRPMTVSIGLREPKAGGGVDKYVFFLKGNLEPLYRVTISPLKFKLRDDCDIVGDSEILVRWALPGGPAGQYRFDTSAGKTTEIGFFAWSRTEVGPSAKLTMPRVGFKEYDSAVADALSADFVHGEAYSPPVYLLDYQLVPGARRSGIRSVSTVMHASNDSCKASGQYTIRYELQFFPFL